MKQPCKTELINAYTVIFRDFFQSRAAHPSIPTHWRPWHEADLFFFAICDGVLPFPICNVVAVLHGTNRHNLARSLKLLGRYFGQPDVPNLAGGLCVL